MTADIIPHAYFIQRCMELARQAAAEGNGPFGSVIVRDGSIVAEGRNRVESDLDVTAHGEIDALRAAARVLGTLDLSGCTVYTNAEPCYMCSYAIRASRVRQVVIGAPSPHSGGVTSPYPVLLAAGVIPWAPPPDVVQGILLEECAALLEEFGYGGI